MFSGTDYLFVLLGLGYELSLRKARMFWVSVDPQLMWLFWEVVEASGGNHRGLVLGVPCPGAFLVLSVCFLATMRSIALPFAALPATMG